MSDRGCWHAYRTCTARARHAHTCSVHCGNDMRALLVRVCCCPRSLPAKGVRVVVGSGEEVEVRQAPDLVALRADLQVGGCRGR